MINCSRFSLFVLFHSFYQSHDHFVNGLKLFKELLMRLFPDELFPLKNIRVIIILHSFGMGWNPQLFYVA